MSLWSRLSSLLRLPPKLQTRGTGKPDRGWKQVHCPKCDATELRTTYGDRLQCRRCGRVFA